MSYFINAYLESGPDGQRLTTGSVGQTGNLHTLFSVAFKQSTYLCPEDVPEILKLNDLNEVSCSFGVRFLYPILDHLKRNPDFYREHVHPSGFGTYEDAVNFLQEIVDLCLQHPWAKLCVE